MIMIKAICTLVAANHHQVTVVGGHDVVNPGVVPADLGVNSRLVFQGAAITPGRHGATGVTLTVELILRLK